jgi:hypothetical protein
VPKIFLLENPKGRDHSEDVAVDGRIIIRMDFRGNRFGGGFHKRREISRLAV